MGKCTRIYTTDDGVKKSWKHEIIPDPKYGKINSVHRNLWKYVIASVDEIDWIENDNGA